MQKYWTTTKSIALKPALGFSAILRMGLVISLLFFIHYPVPGAAQPLSELSEKFENALLPHLLEAKQQARIKPFSSDGCSGGLSEGWETLSDMFPPFSSHFGRLPPWQDCCITHDKVYWQGETQNGYHLRKQADKQLRQCVMDMGIKLAPDLSRRYPFSEVDIERGFDLVANLMYRAVRLGGRPCSGLPWRWGYGWPQCSILSLP